MMNDSVREELQTRLTPVSGSLDDQSKRVVASERRQELAPPPKHVVLEKRDRTPASPTVVPQTAARPVRTASLSSSKTSPTLVDFQAKNTTMPEWRLQMQNAVRQRMGAAVDESHRSVETTVAARASVAARGATALKAESFYVAESVSELADADPRLAAALRRLSDSKKTFLPDKAKKPVAKTTSEARQFPFNVVASTPEPLSRAAELPHIVNERPKPSMVTPLRMEKKLDTNKLPLIETIVTEPFIQPTTEPVLVSDSKILTPRKVFAPPEFAESNRIVINAGHDDVHGENSEKFDETIEDLAPFSMRFNAGLFDLIIGLFASLILLSPIALAGGSWMTTGGLLTLAGTCAMVLFLYTTASVGFFGKTLGMRLFSLELVDAEENEYPTIHQAAVSSSLYILSLALGGLGFLSVFFNEEKRAVHDLLSGTIIVREF